MEVNRNSRYDHNRLVSNYALMVANKKTETRLSRHLYEPPG